MEFNDIQKQCLQDAIAVAGEPIIYQGLTFNALVSGLELSNSPMPGGLEETLNTQVVFPLSAVPTIPKSGDKLIVRSTQEARVNRVVSDAVAYELYCVAA